jgi:transcription antitermination protein NusB
VTGGRRQAREAAIRILYFWDVGRVEPQSAIETYFAEHQPEAAPAFVEFATRLVLGTAGEVADLDAAIARHSHHWRLERLAVIDRLILRMAVWELRHEAGTPPAVVLNEAIELARLFSTDDSVRFINCVLDSVRRSMEHSESAG